MGNEIERKYLIHSLPFNLSDYPCREIEQAYLNTEPVIRIRRQDNDYYLTYKSKGLMVRREENLLWMKLPTGTFWKRPMEILLPKPGIKFPTETI